MRRSRPLGDQQLHDPDGTPQCAGPTPQAFAGGLRGINRPTTIRFGPDGAAYLVDYGAVRDPGQSDPRTAFQNPAGSGVWESPRTCGLSFIGRERSKEAALRVHDPGDAPLAQIPRTGVIWKVSRTDSGRDRDRRHDDDDD